ncbi:MAG: phage baseplate protein [Sandaracinaceae bacterium]
MADIVFDDDGTLVPVVIDATPEERHRMSAIATDHDVERGVTITDHVRPEPRTLTLLAVISDTPIRATDALGGSLQTYELELPARSAHSRSARQTGPSSWEPAEVSERAADPVRVQLFTPDVENPTRVVDTWATLLDARDRALLATVTTRLETYESMVLLEATTTRTAADGTWIRCELTFRQIRQVALELVDDPVPARPRDRARVDRGSQSTEEASPQLTSVFLDSARLVARATGRRIIGD